MQMLRFQKRVLGHVDKCYAALGLMHNDIPIVFFGGEGQGSLRAWRGYDFATVDSIWEGGGGTMSIVPVPEHPDCVLASRGFYSMVDSDGSTIELIRYDGKAFHYETIASLSYLHRFDILIGNDGRRWLLAATLHGGKVDKDDWSKPGGLYAALLPADFSNHFSLSFIRLSGEYTQNHGFCRAVDGRAAYIACKEGVLMVKPPPSYKDDWNYEWLMQQPVSDIALADVDCDGQLEIAALLPFHGNRCVVFRQENGEWREVYEHLILNDFYHAVISAELNGEKVFVVGARQQTQELFLVRWDEKEKTFRSLTIDVDIGPSNVAVLNTPQGDLLLSANRMISEACVYQLNKPR